VSECPATSVHRISLALTPPRTCGSVVLGLHLQAGFLARTLPRLASSPSGLGGTFALVKHRQLHWYEKIVQGGHKRKGPTGVEKLNWG
jgi:hypothetical protein